MTAMQAALNEWRNLLGNAFVLQGEDARSAYGADTSGAERRIPAALRVHDAAMIPKIVGISKQHKIALYPISTGRNWGYGTALPARDDCVILDLSGMRKILHFDPELGVVTVEPGVTQGMLAEFLSAGSHPFLVPVTGAGPQCSLLGNALERGYGITPHADHFAAVNDLEAVLADGSIYRTALKEAGGDELARLFRNGIGPYSAGLFTQSGFGIVTQVSIALARRPESIKVCFFGLKDGALLGSAVERIQTIVGRLPGVVGGVNLMNRHRVLAMSAPYPKDRIGADGLIAPEAIEELGRKFQVLPWTGFATIYGTERIVAAAQKEIRSALSGVASRVVFISLERAETLQKVANLIPGSARQSLGRTAQTLAKALELVNGKPNETALPLAYWRSSVGSHGTVRDPSRDACGLIWYAPLVPMRSADAITYVDLVTRVTKRHGIEPLITFTTLSDKLFDSTVPILFDRANPRELAAASACYADLLLEGRKLGFFPYRVGIDAMPVLSEMMPESNQFHKRLKSSIDPDSLIAPGRYQ